MSSRVSSFPASFAQRRLWFIQQFAPDSAAYNMVVSLPLSADVDAAWLQRALDLLCAHHEALRTSFAVVDGDVVQRIAAEGVLPLQPHYLASPAAFGALLTSSAGNPFRLEAPPLARAHAAFFAEEPPLLALVVHHIVADGVSLQILLADLQTLLQSLLQGRSVQLSSPPVEYADYAVWQRQTLRGRRLQMLTDYWRSRLEGMPELVLPDRRAGGAGGRSARGRAVALQLEPIVCRRLRSIAGDAGATLFGVLLAAFCAVLGRFSGQRDFGVGLPVSSRNRVELDRVVGLFVNSVVFRATLPEGATFAALVRHVAKTLADDLSRQEMPFEQVVDCLRVPRTAGRNPLFQVMMQLQRPTDPVPSAASSARKPVELLDSDNLNAQLELSLILFDAGEQGVEGGFVYASDVFDSAWIEQFATAFRLLLAAAAQSPETPLERLPLLGAPALQELLALGRGPERHWAGATLLHEAFDEALRRHPDAPAIRTDAQTWSFAALDVLAASIAGRLRHAGLEPGDTMGLVARCSPSAVAAMLAALRCGAAYFAVDPAAPPAYREFLLHDSGARVVAVPPGGASLALGLPAVELDVDEVPDGSASRDAERVSALSTAYLIYTSGSTGQPKGVRIPHAAVVNHMRWMLDRFDIGPGDRVLQRTPLSFDASVWEVWAPLLSGATLVLTESDGPFDPARLVRQVRCHAVTTLQVVPSLLAALLPHVQHDELGSLRLLFCGGEVLSPQLVRTAQAVCSATVVNLYGPSETTIDATFHVCPRAESGADPDDVPIGRPVANTTAWVLDERLQPVPWGVAGELCIGGIAVGVGYQRRAELTAERFVADPFTPGGRMFRSGDRARMARDGTLHYLGRGDDQVKLRGFRVELGEVEAHLLDHPSVAEAAAVVQQKALGDQRLVAFVRLRVDRAPVAGNDLTNWLRGLVPAHAVPSSVVLLDALPRTAHGKVDRAALRDRAPDREAAGAAWREPATSLERQICTAFASRLALEQVGVDDDFFLLGGHSLLVISLAEALARTLCLRISVVDVFEFPTPRLLARALEGRRPTSSPGLSRSHAAAEGAA